MTVEPASGTGPASRTQEPSGAVQWKRARVQRRALVVLVLCQVIGGLGVSVSLAVGALVARDLSGSDGWAGAAITMITLGGALAAVPLSRLAARSGRRPALTTGWVVAAGGAVLAIMAVAGGWFPLLLIGFALVGAATAATLQSRFAATDLALPDHRARALSTVVWATTVGAVAGPNLSAPAATLAGRLGWPEMVGPFAVSASAFLFCAAALVLWLRPDPLRTARSLLAPPDRAGARTVPPGARGQGWRAFRSSGPARIAVLVTVTGHAVMVGVMAMTPVHLVAHGASLTIVGVTISLHVAGMYALSPVFGLLADRWGRRPVMVLGVGLLVSGCAAAGIAPPGGPLLPAGLILLGLGWSAGIVAGSTALADAIPLGTRPSAQGVADSLMGFAGAAAGALSGPVLGVAGFQGLCVLAALMTVPAVLVLVRAASLSRRL